MEYIIAGRFGSQEHVAQVVAALQQAHLTERDIASFYVTPPHDTHHSPAGADTPPAGKTEHAHSGAAKGVASGVAAGAAAGMAGAVVLGPAAPAIGALAGAYVGSLAGGLSEIKKTHARPEDVSMNEDPPRQAGMVVAVCVRDQAEEEAAVSVLRQFGAEDLERGEGSVAQGRWQGFDPMAPLHRIEPLPH